MIGQLRSSLFLNVWGLIVFASILFLPDLSINGEEPSFQLIDLLMPPSLIILFINKDKLKNLAYGWFLAIFAFYILATILINPQNQGFNNYFEIYKMLKFACFVTLFTLLEIKDIGQALKLIFISLVIVNLIHFFELFQINAILEHHYGGGIHIEFFGKNSLMQPAVKRMVGTMGNPNLNGILFAFWAIYFIPLPKFDLKKIPWLATALLMLFLCQSRTAVIAIAACFLLIFLMRLSNWNFKNWGIILSLSVTYLIAYAFVTDFFRHQSYSNTLFETQVLETGSVMGRLETWSFLWEMIKEKPLWGHGPNKDFFYENNIYPENEYLFFTWRYGFIGLLLYLSIYFIPLYMIWKSGNVKPNAMLLLCISMMMITALTNTPIASRDIRMIFAMFLGLGFTLLTDKSMLKQK